MANAGWTGFLRIKDDNCQETLNGVKDGLSGLGKKFKSTFGTSVNLFDLISKGFALAKKSAEALIKESRELVTTSQKFSIPIDKLAELRNVSLECGMGMNGLTGAMSSLHTTIIDSIVNPGGKAVFALESIGITQEKLRASSKDTGASFKMIVEGLRGIKNEAERENRAREIFPAQWQEVVVLLKKSRAEIEAMEKSSAKYTESQTVMNARTATSWDRVEQRVKAFGMVFAPILGIFAGFVEFLVVGCEIILEEFKLLAASIWIVMSESFKGIYGDWERFSKKVITSKLILQEAFSNPLKSAPTAVAGVAYLWAKDVQVKKPIEEITKKLKESFGSTYNRINELSDLSRGSLVAISEQAIQFGINMGLEEDWDVTANNKMKKAKEEEIILLTERNAKNTKRESLRADMNKYGATDHVKHPEDYDKYWAAKDKFVTASNEFNLIDDKVIKNKEVQEKIKKDMHRVMPSVEYNEKELKFMQKKKEAEKPKDESFEQFVIRFEQDKKKRQQLIDIERAGLDNWLKWSSERHFAMLNLEKANQNLRQFEASNNKNDVKTKIALTNEQIDAATELSKANREWANLWTEVHRDAMLAETLRKNEFLEGHQGRNMFGMKMRGVSAIDQQNILFKQSVEKLQREELKYDVLRKDKTRDVNYKFGEGPEALALKASINKLTIDSAKEFDSLMAMQYNFVSSDAAKKGMGGGINMVNNPIKIAEQSRDYLKKIYEAQLSGYGINGQFDVVRRVDLTKTGEPIQLSGKDIR